MLWLEIRPDTMSLSFMLMPYTLYLSFKGYPWSFRYMTELRSRFKRTFIKIIPEHSILKLLFAHVSIRKMLSLKRLVSTVNIASCLLAKEAGHLPINNTDNQVGANEIVVRGISELALFPE